MSRRPTRSAVAVENELAERARSAGQGNRSRPREHGDLATYQWGLTGKDRANGCRCEPCVEGNRAYKRRHARARNHAHGHGFVALGTVRPHVRLLQRRGWTITGIADAAQVTENAVRRIAVHGKPNDDVKRHIADALLALPPVAPHRVRRHQVDEAMLERAQQITLGQWTPERDVARYTPVDEWKASAACGDLDPESMLPGRGDSADACRALCAVCPVRGECSDAGLMERFGIWGGLSERERRNLRRQRGIYLIDDVGLEEVA